MPCGQHNFLYLESVHSSHKDIRQAENEEVCGLMSQRHSVRWFDHFYSPTNETRRCSSKVLHFKIFASSIESRGIALVT